MSYQELLGILMEAYKSGERMSYAEAKDRADTVKSALESLGLSDIEYGGSLRRQAPSVGDVDIAVFDLKADAQTFGELINKLKEEGHKVETQYTDPSGVARKMPHGNEQISFLMDGQNVDVKKMDPAYKGAMMIHITGSKDFNVGMRSWLKSFGWSFSQAGLKNENGEVIAAQSEEDIFKKLGMSFIDPKNRDRFLMPKSLPAGAKAQPRRELEPAEPEEERGAAPVPVAILNQLPADVRKRLEGFNLPSKDEEGIPIPRNFLYSKVARNQYYRRRGKFRIPDELKLDRYLGGSNG